MDWAGYTWSPLGLESFLVARGAQVPACVACAIVVQRSAFRRVLPLV